MKHNIKWLVSTVLVYVLLATAVMYSRQITLEGVRGFDFEIFYKTIQKLDQNRIYIDFKHIIDTLTIESGKTIFFSVALLEENSCLENGERNDKICSQYKNINEFNKHIKNVKPRKYYSVNIYDLNDGKSYLYRSLNLGGKEVYLIGEAGRYLGKSNFRAFNSFMFYDWPRYFLSLSTEKGKYGAIKKTWTKTKEIFYLVVTISLILWLLNWFQVKKFRQEYLKSKIKEDQLNSKLNLLDQTYNSLKNERYEKEELIKNLELEMLDMTNKSGEEKSKLREALKIYKDKYKELDQLLVEEEEYIEQLEREKIELNKVLQLQLSKLDKDEQKDKCKFNYEKLAQLELLWRHEPKWIERKNIESLVSLRETHLPFTITQAFIAFENVVSKLTDPYKNEFEGKYFDLNEKIQWIFRNELLPSKYEDDFHDARKARNRWFHSAIYPNMEVITFLIKTLDDVDAEVFI